MVNFFGWPHIAFLAHSETAVEYAFGQPSPACCLVDAMGGIVAAISVVFSAGFLLAGVIANALAARAISQGLGGIGISNTGEGSQRNCPSGLRFDVPSIHTWAIIWPTLLRTGVSQ